MTRADAIRKIRSLQAHAADGAAPEEAATAARLAAQMMRDHKITGADLRAANIHANIHSQELRRAQDRPPRSGGLRPTGVEARPQRRASRQQTGVTTGPGDPVGAEWARRIRAEGERVVRVAVRDFFIEFERALRGGLR